MRADPNRCLLLIDDEPAQRRLVTAIGARAGWWVRGATDFDAAQQMLDDPQEPKFDAILLDHWLPGEEGTELIRQIRALRPDLPLLVLTAQNDVAVAVDAMRAGASDFIVKPLAPDRLLAALNTATDRRKRAGELRPLSEKIAKALGFEEIVGSAPQFRTALAIAAKAARARVSVLIEGESGSGKEIVAQAIHAASPARQEAAPHRQLRRDPRKSRRIGAVRPREGRLHRRLRPPYRPLRGCRRLDHLPRRGRRAAARHPGQIAARARDRRDPARRQPHHPDRRRPHHRRHQPPPRRGGRRRPLPRGPLLPAQRRPRADPAAARPPERHPAARPPPARADRRAARHAPPLDHRRRARRADVLWLARQCPPAPERPVPRRRALRQRRAHRRRFPAHRHRGRLRQARRRLSRQAAERRLGTAPPSPTAPASPCSNPTAICARWKRSRPTSSASPSAIIAAG